MVGMRTVSHVFELLIPWMTLVGEVIESLGCGTSLEEVYGVGGRASRVYSRSPLPVLCLSLSQVPMCGWKCDHPDPCSCHLDFPAFCHALGTMTRSH